MNLRQALALLIPFIRRRMMAQVKSIWLIILYLVFFQTAVLGIGITEGAVISLGIGLVVIGLTLFMEGLLLGLMPLGELIGARLPQRSGLPVVLGFGLILGFLATLAEPSIHVLQTAGKSVKPWEAPLLFRMLNPYAPYLVYAVGAGVGAAVCLGMIRFYRNFSLKPFIYVLVGTLCALTVWASFDPNLAGIIGLAWDCGAVTTGPVTVPLVLALGIGISRMAGTAESGATGFGVVTLASLLPVISVLMLGIYLLGSSPRPMTEADFFRPENRAKTERLFENTDRMTRYALVQASPRGRLAFFEESEETMLHFLRDLSQSAPRKKAIFGDDPEALERWAALHGSEEQRRAVFGSPASPEKFFPGNAGHETREFSAGELLKLNSFVAQGHLSSHPPAFSRPLFHRTGEVAAAG